MITLTYSTTTVTLPNPQVGNKDSYLTNRIINRTLSNYPRTFKDDSWFSEKSLIYDFANINDTLLASLIAFLKSYSGLKIIVRDYNDKYFYGYIIIKNLETHVIRDVCSNSISLIILVDDTVVDPTDIPPDTEVIGIFLINEDDNFIVTHTGGKIKVK